MPNEVSGRKLIWASAPEGQERVACVTQDGATYVERQANNGLPCASVAMMPGHAVAMARAILLHETGRLPINPGLQCAKCKRLFDVAVDGGRISAAVGEELVCLCASCAG